MNDRVTLRRRLVLALLLMFLGGVAFTVYALRIDEIRVTGVRSLDPKVVIEASGLKGGERLLWIRLSAVARRVERIPAIESVTAERSFPRSVVLRVTERTAIARLEGTNGLAIDAKGRMFPAPAGPSLPGVEGWKGRAVAGGHVDRASVEVLNAFADFPSTLRERTIRIIIGPPLTLRLSDGTDVRFGIHYDLARKARIAASVLLAEQGAELEYVDVRAPSVPVSRKRLPPTPAPTPQPTTAPAQPAAPATPSAAPATPQPAATPAPAASPAP